LMQSHDNWAFPAKARGDKFLQKGKPEKFVGKCY